MRKLSFGLFGLALIIGNYLGSGMGMAISLCVCMVVLGLIQEARKRVKGGK